MNTLEDARAWGFVGFKTVAALKRRWTVFRRRKVYSKNPVCKLLAPGFPPMLNNPRIRSYTAHRIAYLRTPRDLRKPGRP